MWKITDGKLLCSAEGNYKEISSDWQFLLTSDSNNSKVWRITDGKLLCSVGGKFIQVSPDWQFFITSYVNFNNSKVWRITDGKLLCSVESEFRKVSPDWQFILTSDDGYRNPKVWRITDGKLLCSVEGRYSEVSPDWQFILTSFTSYGNFRNPNLTMVKVWRTADGKLLCSAEGEYKEISPDWQFLITYNYKNLKVWRTMDILAILKLYSSKFTEQLSVQDYEFFKKAREQSSNQIYTDALPWLDLMIALAEYNLTFDVDISDEIPILEAGEFDFDIEG